MTSVFEALPHRCAVCGRTFEKNVKLLPYVNKFTGNKHYTCGQECQNALVLALANHCVFTKLEQYFPTTTDTKYAAMNHEHQKQAHKLVGPSHGGQLQPSQQQQQQAAPAAPKDQLHCPTCSSYVCSSETEMELHLQTHEDGAERKFACDLCDKKFTHTRYLKSHRLTHTSDRPFQCDQCSSSFKQIQHLKSHKFTHSSERPFACDLCDKKFTHLRYLKSHRLTHSAEKPFACELCERKFTQLRHLRSHEQTHTGEKPFSCEMCERKFSELRHLRVHQQTHTGEKPHECTICGRKYSNKGSLKAHLMVHTGSTLPQNLSHRPSEAECPPAPAPPPPPPPPPPVIPVAIVPTIPVIAAPEYRKRAEFPKQQLKVHVLNDHRHDIALAAAAAAGIPLSLPVNVTAPIPVSTPETSKTFVSQKQATNVVATGSGGAEKPYDCDLCGKRFKEFRHLKSHKFTHTGEKPFECDICTRKFAHLRYLRSHKMTHNRERMFDCDVCGKKFTEFRHMRSHRFTHTGEKPYACDVCGRRYTQKRNLNAHRLSHDPPDQQQQQDPTKAAATAAQQQQQQQQQSNQQAVIQCCPFPTSTGETSSSTSAAAAAAAADYNAVAVTTMASKAYHCWQCDQMFFYAHDYENHMMNAHKNVTTVDVKPSSTATAVGVIEKHVSNVVELNLASQHGVQATAKQQREFAQALAAGNFVTLGDCGVLAEAVGLQLPRLGEAMMFHHHHQMLNVGASTSSGGVHVKVEGVVGGSSGRHLVGSEVGTRIMEAAMQAGGAQSWPALDPKLDKIGLWPSEQQSVMASPGNTSAAAPGTGNCQ